MIKNYLIYASFLSAGLIFTSCNQQQEMEQDDILVVEEDYVVPQESQEAPAIDPDKDPAPNHVIQHTYTDSVGNKLDLKFDNQKNNVTIFYKGDKSELAEKPAASGIWYQNDDYELRGKAEDVELFWKGKAVFKNGGDKVHVKAKNDEGDVLKMTFDHKAKKVEAAINEGSIMELKEKVTSSGIKYTDKLYELYLKDGRYELKKEGKLIFKS